MNEYDDDRGDDRGRDRDDRGRDYDDRPLADPRLARARTGAPGMILIILGIFGLLVGLGVVAFVNNVSVLTNVLKSMEQKEPPGKQKDDLQAQIDKLESADTPEVRRLNTLFYGGTVVTSLLILIGGVKMRSLGTYWLALVGAVVAIIPYNGCCILTTPFGIWAVITLCNADVRAGFAARRSPREEY